MADCTMPNVITIVQTGAAAVGAFVSLIYPPIVFFNVRYRYTGEYPQRFIHNMDDYSKRWNKTSDENEKYILQQKAMNELEYFASLVVVPFWGRIFLDRQEILDLHGEWFLGHWDEFNMEDLAVGAKYSRCRRMVDLIRANKEKGK